MQKIIVAAVAQNGVIGNEGSIPWHSREDMRYFKNLTMGSPVIMGRKTYESMGKPLKGRLNIVLSGSMKSATEGLLVFDSLGKALEYCENEVKSEKVFIIGGGEVYRQAIKLVDEMSISKMKFQAEGSVLFPPLKDSDWDVEVKAEYEDFQVFWYKRKQFEVKS
ncbi:MAG: dihydrofolate reductase [Ignavibacteria bacterium]|nr:dihydrofolate reductase [Ignavibacteria bacterium]MCU7504530.1 dihydrofolate reductase [Ignavibacteria bacterium]MCU7516632.1 dihydrofolate reductase [Ignavibacteria bacterium]